VHTVAVCAAVAAETVFGALYARSEHAFWLDSSLAGEAGGRFSFMGDASGPLARVVRADVWTGRLSVDSCRGRSVVPGSLFDWLEADIAACDVVMPEMAFGFALGWVGYLGYELKADCGADRAHRSPHPDAVMIFADRAIAFDHQRGQVHLLALAEDGDDGPARQWLDRTAALLPALAVPAPPVRSVSSVGALRLRHDRQQYLRRIECCHEQIAAGESYEICLTNMIAAGGDLDAWDCYRLLRRRNPVPFAALLRLGGIAVLSCSPERFLRVSVDGLAESKPIKGTRPRSRSPARDGWLRDDLMASVKDRAEHLMIVDLVRHDLGSVAQVGSVHVPDLCSVQSYSGAHQMVSTVRARLRPGISAVACVRAAFPGGSVTGAPKMRTMQIIDRLESGPRGVYCGALGYFSLSGAADLSIVIRTLVATAGSISFGVGGAITALSDPDAEYEETAVKATPLLRLLGRAFPQRRAGAHGSAVSRQ
jgi:para-aminobenzoate synthetase